MKRRNKILTVITAICISGALWSSPSQADNPFEKLIPRGKLIKKLKSELLGEDERKRPTVRPNQLPTPAQREVRSGSDTKSRQPSPSRANVQRLATQPSGHAVTPRTRPLPPLTDATSKHVVGKEQASRKPDGGAIGFGMMLKTNDNNDLYVARIQPTGNAAKAGLRPGDQIVAAGGGELTAIEEFKQIAKSLGQGDQIEVEYIRQGKKQKSILQFGVAPTEGSIVHAQPVAPKLANRKPHSVDRAMQSVLAAPVEHVSRLQAPAVSKQNNRIRSLNQTIEAQQAKMRAMADELELLRKSQQPAVTPTENSWSFPDLTGPNAP